MTKTETHYLAECRREIEEKLGWLPADEWRSFEFAELSRKVFDDTGVTLSPTTLKRIFGKVAYQNLPSTATLNTLARYLGYKSWMDFKSGGPFLEHKKETRTAEKAKRLFPKKASIGLALLVCLAALLGFFFSPKKASVSTTGKIVFQSRPLSKGLPNTVVFTMGGADIKADDLWIQQSWDSTRTIGLQKGQSEATGFYYFPGYYRAKLIADGAVLQEHDVFVRADNWMATLDQEPVPIYLKPADLLFKGTMTVSDTILKLVAGFSQPTYLTYHLVKPFSGAQMGDFVLETALKNSYGEGNAICQTAKLFVLGTKGAFIVPFTIPGCAATVNLQLGQTRFEGRSNDLSMFGADLSGWNAVRLDVKNNRIKIYLKDKLIREQGFAGDAGAIAGIRFSFLGAGSVKYVRLSNQAGKLIYADDFTQ